MPNPAATFDTITTILTFIMLVGNFIVMLVAFVNKVKTPERNQNARIVELENKVDELYEKLGREQSHIKELEKSNTFTQESLLALLGHAKDGNNVKQVSAAEAHLKNYLVNKGVVLD